MTDAEISSITFNYGEIKVIKVAKRDSF